MSCRTCSWFMDVHGGSASVAVRQVAIELERDVHDMLRTHCAQVDGSVVVWGHPDYGGNDSKVKHMLTEGVVASRGLDRAFNIEHLDI